MKGDAAALLAFYLCREWRSIERAGREEHAAAQMDEQKMNPDLQQLLVRGRLPLLNRVTQFRYKELKIKARLTGAFCAADGWFVDAACSCGAGSIACG
jgi:hypothetical protein